MRTLLLALLLGLMGLGCNQTGDPWLSRFRAYGARETAPVKEAFTKTRTVVSAEHSGTALLIDSLFSTPSAEATLLLARWSAAKEADRRRYSREYVAGLRSSAQDSVLLRIPPTKLKVFKSLGSKVVQKRDRPGEVDAYLKTALGSTAVHRILACKIGLLKTLQDKPYGEKVCKWIEMWPSLASSPDEVELREHLCKLIRELN